ncbi:MAG: phosphatase PAP2 family protein [Bryobacteraceae bacterium]|nr:phosphatase PAP2 family protein [Bryobacteraceae bacterium]
MLGVPLYFTSMRLLRFSELVLIVYFVYAIVVSQVLPVKASVPRTVFVVNVTVLAGILLLAYADGLRRRRPLSIMRDWFPLPLVLLAYRQMGWFAPAHHTYELERGWVVWDRVFLYDLKVRAAVEVLGPVFPSVLEIAYSLVYVIPHFSLAVLYVYRRRARASAFLSVFVLAVLGAYALFPYFPSEPPRTVFPDQDLPSYTTVFRQFNLWLLGGWGIHTSVFPSAHVSGAFSAAFAMRRLLPEKPWVGRTLLVLAILIALATVYGRYHYLVDALAGIALALVAFLFREPAPQSPSPAR